MKRKEDAEQRKQEEAQLKELAQQGHWKAAIAPTTIPKYHLSYLYLTNDRIILL